jgi:hypothetical protein
MTVVLVKRYSAETCNSLVNCAATDISAPRARIRPRFCLCRVIKVGVVVKVTLAMGSAISLQKTLPE